MTRNKGDRVGVLTLIRKLSQSTKGNSKWECRCDCGISVALTERKLRSVDTISCGCKKPKFIHELKHTWSAMIHRCHKSAPGTEAFRHYRGRGICVCDRWIESFESFVEDVGPKPYGTSLDRIDVNGDYTPSNTRWASQKAQSRNQRRYAGKLWIDQWLLPSCYYSILPLYTKEANHTISSGDSFVSIYTTYGLEGLPASPPPHPI